MAIRANPDAKPLLHSDRGSQYTSLAFKKPLNAQGMYHSMSMVGRCIDNGSMEELWGIIKCEWYYIYQFSGEKALCEGLSRFVDYYNHGRYQERFGNRTPLKCALPH